MSSNLILACFSFFFCEVLFIARYTDSSGCSQKVMSSKLILACFSFFLRGTQTALAADYSCSSEEERFEKTNCHESKLITQGLTVLPSTRDRTGIASPPLIPLPRSARERVSSTERVVHIASPDPFAAGPGWSRVTVTAQPGESSLDYEHTVHS